MFNPFGSVAISELLPEVQVLLERGVWFGNFSCGSDGDAAQQRHRYKYSTKNSFHCHLLVLSFGLLIAKGWSYDFREPFDNRLLLPEIHDVTPCFAMFRLCICKSQMACDKHDRQQGAYKSFHAHLLFVTSRGFTSAWWIFGHKEDAKKGFSVICEAG